MLDKKTFESILHLSRLDIEQKYKEQFARQTGGILDYFDLLKNYDTSHIDVDLGALISSSELREDVPGKSFTHEQLEQFAIHFADGFFTVPKILEEFEEKKEESNE